MPIPTADCRKFDSFVAWHLRQNAGRFSASAEAVYEHWLGGRCGSESFLDYLTDRGVFDRVVARAVFLAWQGRLDARDVRQLSRPDSLGRSLRRLIPAQDERPPIRRRQVVRAIGTRLGRYVIKGILGWGGSGPVYLAVHPTLRSPVALKVVGDAAGIDGESLRESLRTEARLQSSISHPNVVRVWDYEDEETPFLVLEYVHGEDLRDRLADKSLGLTEGFTLLMHVALGLRAANRAGIIHSDVKPANILVTPEGGFKITDFGLARSRRSLACVIPGGLNPPRPVARGSLNYMAPEQFENCHDRRSDIYALGLSVYHALAGLPPISGQDPDAVMLRHKKGDFSPLHQVAPDVSHAVSDLIQRMCAVDPDLRLQDYDELLEAAEAAFGLRLASY